MGWGTAVIRREMRLSGNSTCFPLARATGKTGSLSQGN
jgi:hypothetical protein